MVRVSLRSIGCVQYLLRILDDYPGIFSIPEEGQKDSGSRIRIRIKEFKYFKPKTLFLGSRKCDPGCSSRIQISDLDFLPSGSRSQKGIVSRINNIGYVVFLLLILGASRLQQTPLDCGVYRAECTPPSPPPPHQRTHCHLSHAKIHLPPFHRR
jgi:hypothetical protein